MKKMAIVSSYNESCGNASFAHVLKESIECYHDVEVTVLPLRLSVLQVYNFKIRKRGDKHIREICQQLKAFDSVNIQFEPGLYGTNPRDILRRASWLFNANPNTSITLHSPRLIESIGAQRYSIKALLSLKIKKLFFHLKQRTVMYKLTFNLLKKIKKTNCRLIVHTKRAHDQIKEFYPEFNIDVHPLKFIDNDAQINSEFLNNFRKTLNLGPEIIFIGMFGYISSYKGFRDALQAITLLPPNHHLLIFGRQHPQTVNYTGKTDKYLNKLLNFISKNNFILERVHFIGEVNDNDFIDAASHVDCVWLPYYENGQDGSGIASICFDLNSRILCSTSFSFDQLFKLIPYPNAMRFDIGNFIELAQKTAQILKMPKPEKPYSSNAAYSVQTQTNCYVTGGV